MLKNEKKTKNKFKLNKTFYIFYSKSFLLIHLGGVCFFT